MLSSSCFRAPDLENLLCNETEPCPEGLACGPDRRCHAPCGDLEPCADPVEGSEVGPPHGLDGGADPDGGGDFGADRTVRPDASVAADPDADGAPSPDTGPDDAGVVEEPLVGCLNATDCATPGPCEQAANAECRNGRCAYPLVACMEPPSPVCLRNDTVFRLFSDIGICSEVNGACEYSVVDISCPSCMSSCLAPCSGIVCNETNGGCRAQGFCMPGSVLGEPPQCVYTNAVDRTRCTLSSGLPGGLCRQGTCVECLTSTDCLDGDRCTVDSCDSGGVCRHARASGSAEQCDGLDNDCDGTIDENLTRVCATACGSGIETCIGGTYQGCTAPPPSAEQCDGADNDCDGVADDGLTRTCSTACGTGTETCTSGTFQGCTARVPEAERCDGVDNDCDGRTDEGFAFLRSGESLTPSQELWSCNQGYRFVHQGDGNVVLYNTATQAAIWSSATNGQATTALTMQTDGNLVLYNGTTALWATATEGNPGAMLAVQDDGNAVIYAGTTALWATNTAGQ